jgi:1,2-diacylglycerol 3-alpha-glucosyltransferase
MKICMMTNTYLPHVGGVARSVSTFAEEFQRLGHEVLVVAPEFDGRRLPARSEAIVERIPSLRNFNGSDFSVRLPLVAGLSDRIDAFQADIIHAHHPFLLGDTALRLAMNKNVPIIFTHHTKYEDYTHYVPFSEALREAAIEIPTHFANLCDGVIAPSESMAAILRKRGVRTRIEVVPTGIDVKAFGSADGRAFREKMRIPPGAFVVGHVGRLAPEKNLAYLGEAVALYLKNHDNARFLVVGDGPERAALKAVFQSRGLGERLLLAGKRTGRVLQEAYRAMDVFGFASTSETQGMVVAEAMAAGCPVVALNASGVREVVGEGENGFLLAADAPPERMAGVLARLEAEPELRARLSAGARVTAQDYSRERSAKRALAFYEEIRRATRARRLLHHLHPWSALVQRVGLEWDLLSVRTQSVAAAVFGEEKEHAS